MRNFLLKNETVIDQEYFVVLLCWTQIISRSNPPNTKPNLDIPIIIVYY